MKYLFILIIISGSAFAQMEGYNEPLLDDSIREYQETEAIQAEERQEEQAPKFDREDPLGEFEDPKYDTGNGKTTNQKNLWPEP